MSSRARLALAPFLSALLGASDCAQDINDQDVVIAVTSRLSVDASGTEANLGSEQPSVTPDGRYLAFVSSATNLVPGVTPTAPQIYVKDLLIGTVVIVSVNSSGVPANRNCAAPSISANGRRVAFHSEASNLAATDPNTAFDVFVRDLDSAQTFHISQAFGGGPSVDAMNSGNPSLSADGMFVAFESDGTDLVDPPTSGGSQIYRRQVDTNTTLLVSVNELAEEANNNCFSPSISGNGSVIAFDSSADNLSSLDAPSTTDVYVRDISSGMTELVSVEAPGNPDGIADGVQANGQSTSPWLSADGQVVAFESTAPDLIVGDVNGRVDVFLRRRGSGPTLLVSKHSSGAQGSRDSAFGVGSTDGRYVAFSSQAPNLVDKDTNLSEDYFWHDTVTGKTVRVSVATGGGEALGADARPSMTADGRFVFFHSDSGLLVEADTNGANDIFSYGPLY